jgi:hypothetical protein
VKQSVQIACGVLSAHMKAIIRWKAIMRDTLSTLPAKRSVFDLEGVITDGERQLVCVTSLPGL